MDKFAILVSVVIVLFIITLLGCGLLDAQEEDTIEFVLEPRLERDDNGYFHLELSRTSLQTIHRLSGHVSQDDEPLENVKFLWESSHQWTLGDTIGYIVQQGLSDTYEYISYDTSYIYGFSGFEVPTINCCSYSNSDGEVNSMFAPIYAMLGDSVRISVSALNESVSFRIVLD